MRKGPRSLSSASRIMTQQSNRPERRKQSRIRPKGTVTLTVGTVVLQGRVANLSRSGLYVATRVSAPERLLARDVDIQLRLDGQAAEWLPATGRVARIDVDGLAITLETVSDVLGDLIDEMCAQSHLHGRTVSVVLIDGNVERSASMVDGFRAAGCTVMHVSTPLEAIVRLGESSFEPDLVAIGDTVSGSAEELRTFVQRSHPRAKLVAIGTDAGSEITSEWLSSDNPESDLPTRVLRVLGRPRRT